jgi:[ribosomal protein S5]-alanine N-acetyltransferase
MKNSFLVGSNVYLRGLEERDLEGGYVSWFNDEEVCKYNSHHVFPYNYEQAKKYILWTHVTRGALILAIVLKSNNKHIGNISLQNIDYVNRNSEFAVIVGDKECWGKGYSKEASFLILKHGFVCLNLHRIYCGTSTKNVPMQKLAKSLFMTQEGLRKENLYKDGKFVDMIEYGVIRNDFLIQFQRREKYKNEGKQKRRCFI